MASKRQQHLHQYTTNISQVLRNRVERAKASYINSGNNYFVLYNGNVLTPAAFDELLPIEVKCLSVKGEGCSSHQKLVA